MESSIAAFLMRWSACELLPTMILRVVLNRRAILFSVLSRIQPLQGGRRIQPLQGRRQGSWVFLGVRSRIWDQVKKHKFFRHCKSAPVLLQAAPSTILAQDHFYSDFLSLSLTILTHIGSLMIICDC